MTLRISALCCLHAYLIPAATVEGFVVYGDGKPVLKAQVEVVNPYQARGSVTEYVYTDQEGYFKVSGLSPALYMVYSSKEDEGYGNTESAFFAVGRPKVPEITIRDSDETVRVKVDLGSPGGFVKGAIIDERTREPVPGSSLWFAIQADPGKFLSFRADEHGSFETLVPSQPLVLSASAAGYQAQEVTLSLKSGEHKSLTIELKKP